MKRVLIIGAGGFIGGFMARKSLDLGYETWVGVRESTSRRYLDDARIKFLILDYDSPQALAEAFDSALPHGDTAANIKNGGRTPIAGMVHSVTLVLILVILMPYAALIPMPCIAAILFMVAYNMSGWRSFVNLVKSSPKSDIIVLVLSFVLTVVFDLVLAIEASFLEIFPSPIDWLSIYKV